MRRHSQYNCCSTCPVIRDLPGQRGKESFKFMAHCTVKHYTDKMNLLFMQCENGHIKFGCSHCSQLWHINSIWRYGTLSFWYKCHDNRSCKLSHRSTRIASLCTAPDLCPAQCMLTMQYRAQETELCTIYWTYIFDRKCCNVANIWHEHTHNADDSVRDRVSNIEQCVGWRVDQVLHTTHKEWYV